MGEAAKLYDDDFLTWAERQASELRALSARPDLSNIMDWDNLIEEVEALGRHEWKTVRSKLVLSLMHLIKGVADPSSLSMAAWASETAFFFLDAREDHRRSMNAFLEPDKLWRDACSRAAVSLKEYGVALPTDLPQNSPFTLAQLLDPELQFDNGVSQIKLHMPPPLLLA